MTDVVDASLVAAFFLGEPAGEKFEVPLNDLREKRGSVCVPSLFWFELTNVLVMAERKGRVDSAEADRLHALAGRLPFETDDPPLPSVRMRIAELARQHALSAYEAACLELALRLRARRLHTLDQALLDLAPQYSMIS